MQRISRKILKLFLYFLIFISILIIFSSIWLEETFGLIDIDKLIFHLMVPLEGSSHEMIISYLKSPLLKSIIIYTLVILILNYNYKYIIKFKIDFFKKKIVLNGLNLFKVFFTFIIFIFSISFFIKKFEVLTYIKSLNTYSSFIEDNYVEPENTNISFPNRKRNLIHIYLESMEYTYTSIENGGAYEENLIPNLTRYANSYISFRNENGGGFINSRATGWTIAGLVAQSAGIGFLVPGDGNEYGKYNKFLPGAYSLGDILEKEGYNQVLLIGSEAEFGGREKYYLEHGNYEIKDYNYAINNNWIDDDYYVWWGYEDSKLFSFAKNELMELGNKKKPFNLTLLTTNTHHIGGYLEDSCEIKYEEKLKNVVSCSDMQVYEFVEWIKTQPFYENTTIVITGDHLSMEPTFFNDLNNYERTNYNVFINSYSKTNNINNRSFNSRDIYPTIIGSLGGNIPGDRLGLGTNMFSNTKTLYEEYGREFVDKELSYNSLYFKNHILYGKKS